MFGELLAIAKAEGVKIKFYYGFCYLFMVIEEGENGEKMEIHKEFMSKEEALSMIKQYEKNGWMVERPTERSYLNFLD
jgi:hypothetical protein